MIHLVLGSMLIWMAGLAIGHVWNWESAAATGEDGGSVAWLLIAFPPLAVWLTAEFINAVTPRRLFDRRTVAPVRRATVGALAGVIGFTIAVLALPLTERHASDWATLAGASAIGTFVTVVFLPRVRRGHCVVCGYDLRTLPSMERCPECGQTGVL